MPNTNFLFTALYTGSLGNQITVTLSTGSQAGTWRLTVSLPGGPIEVFDNIGGNGAAFWQNLAAAVNGGQGPQRGPSQIVVANANAHRRRHRMPSPLPSRPARPAADGANVTASNLVGVDQLPRPGMYALRGQGCSIAVLADADDSTQWTTQAAFGLSEGIYMILTGPSGDTIANAVATKQSPDSIPMPAS